MPVPKKPDGFFEGKATLEPKNGPGGISGLGDISETNTLDQTRVSDEWDINVLSAVQVQFWTTKRYHRLINRTKIRDYRRQ